MWSYLRQDEWPGYCTNGQRQSPINLDARDLECSPYDAFSVQFQKSAEFTFEFIHNMWVSVPTSTYGTLVAQDINGVIQSYVSAQFHLHSVSEHAINGRRTLLELHFVFRISNDSVNKTTDRLAVVGLQFNTIADNDDVSDFMRAVDLLKINEYTTMTIKMDELIGRKLMDHESVIHYKGSLTTPDCDEVVNWYVVDTPFSITEDELQFFNITYTQNNSYYPDTGNARILQPLNGRQLIKFCNIYTNIASEDSPAMYLALIIIGCYITLMIVKKEVKHDYAERLEEPTILALHPLYSLYKYPNRKGFSLKARLTLLFLTIMTQFALEASLLNNQVERHKIRVVAAAIYGVFGSIPVVYVIGLLFVIAHKKETKSALLSRLKIDTARSLKLYFYGFSWFVMGADFFEISQDAIEFTEDTNYLIMFSLLIGLFIDFCILDILTIVIAQMIPATLNIFKLKGYYFDGIGLMEDLKAPKDGYQPF